VSDDIQNTPQENTSAQNSNASEDKPAPSEGERTFGMLVHLLGIFTSFVGPLIVWLVKKEEMPFVDDQGKEALNFQITVILSMLALIIGMGVLSFIPFVGWIFSIIAVFLYIVIWLGALVMMIIATIEANKGNYFRHPFCLRLIK
jgi:uncharacterized Tic20 family protein